MKHRRLWLAGIVIALSLLAAVALAACGEYLGGAVTFPDAQHGWVTGWDDQAQKTVLLRTTDGGETWARAGARSTKQSRGAKIVGWAEFATPTGGVWMVGLNKLLYTTTGGRPWALATVRSLNGRRFTTQSCFSAASFADAAVGWATISKIWIGENGYGQKGGWIARTRNGGATWRIMKAVVGKNVRGGFVDVAAPTRSVCYALKAGDGGGVWVTTDRGVTWKRYFLPVRNRAYIALDFVDAKTGWAVGANGMIAKTTDGGLTWTSQVSGTTEPLHGVCFWNADIGYAVGEQATILATQNGGASWTPQASGIAPDPNIEGDNPILNDVDVVSATEAWAVRGIGWMPGLASALVHTTDGGQTWMLVQ